jgi:hypothetical protein
LVNALELLEPGSIGSDPPECPYAPLLGSWEIVSRWFLPDGGTRDADGEWHFSLVLGGYGVEDVIFRKGDPVERRVIGLRCYDSAIQAWRVCSMGPAGGEFVALVARAEDDRIVQEGADLDGRSLQRWTFSEIGSDSFLWRGEESVDGGSTWRLDQEMRARRSAEH